jgi:zinc transporter ZupT
MVALAAPTDAAFRATSAGGSASNPVGVNGALLAGGAEGAFMGTSMSFDPVGAVSPGAHVEKYAGRTSRSVIRLRVTMEVLAVFVVALATALATGLGALPFVFARRPDRSWLGNANSLAAGLMLGASGGLLYEGFRYGVGRTVVGALVGGVFILVSQRLIGAHENLHLGSLRGADATKALLIVGVMTLHSFAEGVGVGVAFGVEQSLGVLIGVAIAVHNIPEGLAISLVLVPRGTSARNAAAWSIFSSLPQPLMAVPAFLFVESFQGFLPVGLGFAAGAMVWLVLADLLPEALETSRPRTVVPIVAGSAVAMLLFVLLLL